MSAVIFEVVTTGQDTIEGVPVLPASCRSTHIVVGIAEPATVGVTMSVMTAASWVCVEYRPRFKSSARRE